MSETTKLPCGIIMKGGITSGLVYPRAVVALAKHFCFREIGGTSAGAIAAAATAAAEYGRSTGGNPRAFEEFARLPEQMGGKVNSTQSRLLTLFQPDSATGDIFNLIFNTLATPQNIVIKLVKLGLAAIVASPRWILIVLLVVTLGGWPAGLALADHGLVWQTFLTAFSQFLLLTISLIATMGIAILDFARSLPTRLAENNYGLCSAHSRTAYEDFVAKNATKGKEGKVDDTILFSEKLPLTDWLYAYLQHLAGKPLDDPLTFGDLWGSASPDGGKPKDPTISLEMNATCLSHARPYRLPEFSGRFREFYFNEEEMRRYFPDVVVKWLLKKQRPLRKSEQAQGLGDSVPFPLPCDMPVIIAVRMSLSFPILFAAIPLRSIDFRQPKERRMPEVCWFTDGGITSNFPMHLFDRPLPPWPVFGLNLREFPQELKKRRSAFQNKFAKEIQQKRAKGDTTIPQPTLPEEEIKVVVKSGSGVLPSWTRWEREIGEEAEILSLMQGLEFRDPSGVATGVDKEEIADEELQEAAPAPANPKETLYQRSNLFGFLGAVWNAAQNWNDNLQLTTPGYRDRIAHVHLDASEGGLNLNMDSDVIQRLAERGENAASGLSNNFATDENKDKTGGVTWDNHRWWRFRTTFAALQPFLDSIAHEIRSPGYEEVLKAAADAEEVSNDWSGKAAGRKQKRSQAIEEAKKINAVVAMLTAANIDYTDGSPSPPPSIRIGPRV